MIIDGQNVIFKVDIPTIISDMTGQDANSPDLVQTLTQQLVNSFVGQDGLNITNPFFQGGLKTLNQTQRAREDLHESTRPDGTVDMPAYRSKLEADGISTSFLPPGDESGIPASAVEEILDSIDASLSQADFEISRSELIGFLSPILKETLDVAEELSITSQVSSPQGKWASAYGNVIVLDSSFVVPMLTKRFFAQARKTPADTEDIVLNQVLNRLVANKGLQNGATNAAYAVDPNQYSMQVDVLLKNREKIYNSQDGMQPALIKASDKIYSRIGLEYPISMSNPLSEVLNTFFLFQDFLNNVFTAVMFLLILLSILLIYSLMNSNLEEKNYEFGMLRVLGMKKNSLVFLLSLQSLFFAIPGLALGFMTAYAINAIIYFVVFNNTYLPTSYGFPGESVAIGLCVGIIIPFLSNIIPIHRALSQTLRDSLNIFHRVVGDISIKVQRLSSIGISVPQTLGAAILISLGIVSFYVAPKSYAFSDTKTFFLVLNVVFMFTIFGVALLASLVQAYVERAVLFCILLLFCKDKKLGSVIRKNFIAHKDRNNKTSLMFILALAFLIFAGAGFKLSTEMVSDQLKSTYGSDLVVQSLSFETTYLDQAAITAQIEQFKVRFPHVVKSYAFISKAFSKQPFSKNTQISSLTSTPFAGGDIISVDASYLDAAYADYYVPNSYDKHTPYRNVEGYDDKLNGVRALYEGKDLITLSSFDPSGVVSMQNLSSLSLSKFVGFKEIRCIIDQGTATALSVTGGNDVLLTFGSTRFRARVRNVATKLPGFTFTGYNTGAFTTVIVSHEDYQYMRNILWAQKTQPAQNNTIKAFNATIPANSTYGIPKVGLVIRVNDKVSDEDRTRLFNAVQVLITGKYTTAVDVAGMVKSLHDALFFIDVFSIIVSIVAIFLSFFFTIIAFVGNVSENLWEFGVLRAVGLTKRDMSKTYTFEALSIIIGAGILGTVVGCVVALMSAIQFHIFTEIPLQFKFPVAIFCIAIGASILTAIFGSKIAVDDVKNRQISSIIKALE